MSQSHRVHKILYHTFNVGQINHPVLYVPMLCGVKQKGFYPIRNATSDCRVLTLYFIIYILHV